LVVKGLVAACRAEAEAAEGTTRSKSPSSWATTERSTKHQSGGVSAGKLGSSPSKLAGSSALVVSVLNYLYDDADGEPDGPADVHLLELLKVQPYHEKDVSGPRGGERGGARDGEEEPGVVSKEGPGMVRFDHSHVPSERGACRNDTDSVEGDEAGHGEGMVLEEG
jgi:hypothetical protein